MYVIVGKTGMNLDKQKLSYLFIFIEDYILKNIYNILSDSKEDPHYSAVTTTNIIKCYIDVQNQLGTKLPYDDVKSYFKIFGFTDEEYLQFEESRKKESEYYIGWQYSDSDGQ